MYDNNSYDRAPSEIGARSFAQIQASFINRVFGWMTLGLAITGIVSVYLATQCGDAVIKYRGLYPVLLIAEVLLVLGLSFLIKRISSAIAFIGFILFAVLNGITLSWIFFVYTPQSIAATFFTTSGTFGAMGLYGYMTKKDLTTIGNLCFMGLFGLIIASIVNMFFPNYTANLIISVIGVIIFVGLVAYDTQKIKQLSFAVAEGELSEEDSKKGAIIGALELYLDFINLFIYILRLFGNRK